MYILECSDGTYYTGSTLDLGKRLWEHQNGLGANYTRKRRPVRLSYCEPYDRVEDAFLREKHVQGWSRAKKEALMAGDLPRLVLLARNRDSGPPPLTVASTSSATGTLEASTQDDAVAEPVEARSLSLSKRGRRFEVASTSSATGTLAASTQDDAVSHQGRGEVHDQGRHRRRREEAAG